MSRFPSFRLSVKTGTGLCFCWSLPFLLVTDVQPPLCWWPRKFWTAALFGSRDWGKVFKVKSVFFFFFFFFKIEFTRNKTSSCLWGPCLLQNLQRLPAWTGPLWGLQTCLKLLEKKNGFSKGNNEIKPWFYFFYFILPSSTDRKMFKSIFSWMFFGQRLKRTCWKISVKLWSWDNLLNPIPPNLCLLLLSWKRLSDSGW